MTRNTVEYKDGLMSRDRQSMLLFSLQGEIARFKGENIRGVCRIVGRQCKQSGKWSNTIYQIETNADARAWTLEQSFEEGKYLPEMTWEKVFSRFGKHLGEEVVVSGATEAFVRAHLPGAAKVCDRSADKSFFDDESAIDELRAAREVLSSAHKEVATEEDHLLQRIEAEEIRAAAQAEQARAEKLKSFRGQKMSLEDLKAALGR